MRTYHWQRLGGASSRYFCPSRRFEVLSSTIGLAGYDWLYVSERDTTRNLARVNAPYLYDTKRSNKRNLCKRHSTTVRPGAILTGNHIALS